MRAKLSFRKDAISLFLRILNPKHFISYYSKGTIKWLNSAFYLNIELNMLLMIQWYKYYIINQSSYNIERVNLIVKS